MKAQAKRINTTYSKMASILVFFYLLANYSLLPRLKENILLNYEFKNEATRANLQVNKRTQNGDHFVIRCMNEIKRDSKLVFVLFLLVFSTRNRKHLIFFEVLSSSRNILEGRLLFPQRFYSRV